MPRMTLLPSPPLATKRPNGHRCDTYWTQHSQNQQCNQHRNVSVIYWC